MDKKGRKGKEEGRKEGESDSSSLSCLPPRMRALEWATYPPSAERVGRHTHNGRGWENGSFSPWEPNKAFACPAGQRGARIASAPPPCRKDDSSPFLFRTPSPLSLSLRLAAGVTIRVRRGRRRLITMTRPLKREMRG